MQKSKRIETGYKKSISDSEIIELDNFFANEIKDKAIVMAYLIMRYTGMPINETVNLKPENFNNNKITTIRSKTNRVYETILPDKVYNWFKAYCLLFKNEIIKYGYICFSDKNPTNHIAKATLRHKFKEYRRLYHHTNPYYITKSGKPLFSISVHTLRHYVATKIYQKTKDPILIKNILNHSKLETSIKHYISDCTIDDKKNALDLL